MRSTTSGDTCNNVIFCVINLIDSNIISTIDFSVSIKKRRSTKFSVIHSNPRSPCPFVPAVFQVAPPPQLLPRQLPRRPPLSVSRWPHPLPSPSGAADQVPFSVSSS